jgi:hypothetical protein
VLNETDPAATAAAVGFAAHIFGGFRFEAICGTFLYALLSTALAYTSSCPTPHNRVNAALYWLW